MASLRVIVARDHERDELLERARTRTAYALEGCLWFVVFSRVPYTATPGSLAFWLTPASDFGSFAGLAAEASGSFGLRGARRGRVSSGVKSETQGGPCGGLHQNPPR